ALDESLNIVLSEHRGKDVLNKAKYLREKLKSENINIGESESQIIPIIVGDNKSALNLMNYLKDKGFFAPAVRPPTVPPNQSRVRLSLSYGHSYDDIDNLFQSIMDFFRKAKQ
ncbi:MAG TPA: aminotransferase class I/II-fold pyridoxal phosphate-dependent enzyme, partial [Spirochaetota bacterium]|nr:aminotransferase class I/II-fold pyridoxal phosphate-dependent enzyme [Spirochaetota bacterium]